MISQSSPHSPAPQRAAERYALIAGGAVIVALTIGAFWLSYAHLAEVAGRHGLGGSPTRRWAWPATLDAFIVAGEVLMLRAGLRRVTDGWAIALTAAGSVGSIALNVAGVSGSRPSGEVPVLDYVVAAVPPTAALLAFGVLMRQIHQLVDHAPVSVTSPELPAARPFSAEAAMAASSFEPTEPPIAAAENAPRGGRPPGATVEELVEIGRSVAAEEGKLTRALLRKAVADKGLTISSQRQTQVMNLLRSEPGTAPVTGADTS